MPRSRPSHLLTVPRVPSTLFGSGTPGPVRVPHGTPSGLSTRGATWIHPGEVLQGLISVPGMPRGVHSGEVLQSLCAVSQLVGIFRHLRSPRDACCRWIGRHRAELLHAVGHVGVAQTLQGGQWEAGLQRVHKGASLPLAGPGLDVVPEVQDQHRRQVAVGPLVRLGGAQQGGEVFVSLPHQRLGGSSHGGEEHAFHAERREEGGQVAGQPERYGLRLLQQPGLGVGGVELQLVHVAGGPGYEDLVGLAAPQHQRIGQQP
mmetsp:Transcript_12134/g.36473  ORF Transcript_12134/g.36473 Transcript_12134/m.36473 type:complete len:260 (-) Transcript_12134:1281-2060(-)